MFANLKWLSLAFLKCESSFEEAKEGNNKGKNNPNKYEMEKCSTQNIQRKTIKESKHIDKGWLGFKVKHNSYLFFQKNTLGDPSKYNIFVRICKFLQMKPCNYH